MCKMNGIHFFFKLFTFAEPNYLDNMHTQVLCVKLILVVLRGTKWH